MHIMAFNGSPRKNGNTSTIIRAILEGAKSAGAETTEVVLDEIEMKGCMGCLSCRKNHGVCARQDALSPYLEDIKESAGIIVGCPIYMYRMGGQIKLLVDRMYSLYPPGREGGYGTAVPAGKTYGLVVSQGAPDPDQYKRSIRWLAGMTGTGLGMEEVGRIIHADSYERPAKDHPELLAEAHRLGRRMLRVE